MSRSPSMTMLDGLTLGLSDKILVNDCSPIPIRAATLGIQRCIDETHQYLSHLQNVHISFDIDVMDPAYLPGVSVPVPGGLLEEEAFTLMHQLLTGLPVISCDIVEFNKDYDISDRTATFARQMAHQILTDDVTASLDRTDGSVGDGVKKVQDALPIAKKDPSVKSASEVKNSNTKNDKSKKDTK